MLKIKNLTVVSESEELLTNINLEVNEGEIHAIMGPMHSGKTALAHSISGHPNILINNGSITFNRKKINNIDIEERYKLGIFTTFQYPPEFEGLTNWDIAKSVFSDKENDLQLKYSVCATVLGLDEDHKNKQVNGISMNMSDAKKNEIILMMLRDPKLVVLDEVDQGLTDDEIVIVGLIVKDFLAASGKACIVITHSHVLLDTLTPTHVHVMVNGKIIAKGGADLHKRIIEDGYPEFS